MSRNRSSYPGNLIFIAIVTISLLIGILPAHTTDEGTTIEIRTAPTRESKPAPAITAEPLTATGGMTISCYDNEFALVAFDGGVKVGVFPEDEFNPNTWGYYYQLGVINQDRYLILGETVYGSITNINGAILINGKICADPIDWTVKSDKYFSEHVTIQVSQFVREGGNFHIKWDTRTELRDNGLPERCTFAGSETIGDLSSTGETTVPSELLLENGYFEFSCQLENGTTENIRAYVELR